MPLKGYICALIYNKERMDFLKGICERYIKAVDDCFQLKLLPNEILINETRKEFNGDLVINFRRGRQILTHSVSGEMYYTDFVNSYGFELAVIE